MQHRPVPTEHHRQAHLPGPVHRYGVYLEPERGRVLLEEETTRPPAVEPARDPQDEVAYVRLAHVRDDEHPLELITCVSHRSQTSSLRSLPPVAPPRRCRPGRPSCPSLYR